MSNLREDSKPRKPPTERMPTRMRLGARARLRNASEFQRVRQEGKSAHGRWMVAGALASRTAEPARVGVIASRRVGNAVVRARARRRLRELFRVNRSRLEPGTWVVLIAKRGIGDAPYDKLRDEWLRLAGRLSILLPFSPTRPRARPGDLSGVRPGNKNELTNGGAGKDAHG